MAHTWQVLKCASQGWYPTYLMPHKVEVALPEASGVILTTGNLEDISIEAGQSCLHSTCL